MGVSEDRGQKTETEHVVCVEDTKRGMAHCLSTALYLFLNMYHTKICKKQGG